MEQLVYEHHDFKVDSLPNRQPVKLPQHRRDVLSSTSSSDQPSCRILYRLQALDQTVGDAAQKSVTVVQSTGDERLD